MKILIHDYPGHPFQVQLSRKLAERGHQVLHLYAGYNVTPRGELTKREDDPESFSISPIFIRKPLQKYSFLKRWYQEREYGNLLSEEITKYSPDLVIAANTPLDAQRMALSAAQKIDARFIFWLQDVIGIASHRILREKLPVLGDIIGKYYLGLEQKLLRASDHVVLITDGFQPLMLKWGIDQKKTTVIPNWAPLEDLSPDLKENDWSIKNDVSDKFCFMYTGTLGMKHNPGLLLELAIRFKDYESVRVMVISEGPGADWLEQKKKELGLMNLLLLPYQPFEVLPQVMASADVLIALLEVEAGVFSVPSKVLTYLCTQRPLLIAVPEENLAAKIVKQHEAGFVIPPEQKELFLSKAVLLYNKVDIRRQFGENGRRYAEKTFDINRITDQFEGIIHGLEV